MTARCPACHAAINTGGLCRNCTRDLERAIAELPALARDLELVATLQASGPLGLGDPHRQWDEPPADGALGDAPWEFSPGAADQLWAATNTIAGWVRHLVERYGYDVPTATRGRWSTTRQLVIHRNRARWRDMHVWLPAPEQPITPVVTWLLGHVDTLARDDHAAQALEEFTGLHADMTAAVLGRRPAEAFYGTCDRPDVSVSIDTGRVVPELGKCGAQLFGTEDAARINCPACGASYTRGERFAAMVEQLMDTLGTVRQVASTLTRLERPVTVGQIDGWLRRSLILPRGIDQNGHRLVRVGDVIGQRAAMIERARGKRSKRAA